MSEQNPNTPLERLEFIGFERAGKWVRTETGIAFDLINHARANNILYAFVVASEVVYVGKSVQTLRQRLSGYKNPAESQTTNLRNHQMIKDALDAGQEVEIFVLPDNGLLHYGGFHVNLAAGLEDSIIKQLSPPWNGRG